MIAWARKHVKISNGMVIVATDPISTAPMTSHIDHSRDEEIREELRGGKDYGQMLDASMCKLHQ